MTDKFVHDRNDHTDEHERWNLTENVSQRRTLTGEYDRNFICKQFFYMPNTILRLATLTLRALAIVT